MTLACRAGNSLHLTSNFLMLVLTPKKQLGDVGFIEGEDMWF